jgi:alpha-tubulin suppressor-like RCC1 family protein
MNWKSLWVHERLFFTVGVLSLTGIALAAPPRLAAGDTFSMGLSTTGEVSAWGSNIFSQLGDGTGAFRATPFIAGVAPGLRRTVGGNQCSYAVMEDGTLWAWGDNSNGQLGDGTTRSRISPVRVMGIPSRVLGVASGARHALAVDQNGQVWAWGSGDYGQLGRETTRIEPTALRVGGLPAVNEVSAGVYHSFALADDGKVWAWGYNADG